VASVAIIPFGARAKALRVVAHATAAAVAAHTAAIPTKRVRIGRALDCKRHARAGGRGVRAVESQRRTEPGWVVGEAQANALSEQSAPR